MSFFTRQFVTTEKGLFKLISHYTRHRVGAIIDYCAEHNATKESAMDYLGNMSRLFQTYPMMTHTISPTAVGMDFRAFHDVLLIASGYNCACVVNADDKQHALKRTVDVFVDKAVVDCRFDTIDIFKTYQMDHKGVLEHLQEDLVRFRTLNLNHNIKLVRDTPLHWCATASRGIAQDNTDTDYDRGVRILLNHAEANKRTSKVIFATHNDASIDLFANSKLTNVSHVVLMGMEAHLRFDDPEYTINRSVQVPFCPTYRTYWTQRTHHAFTPHTTHGYLEDIKEQVHYSINF